MSKNSTKPKEHFVPITELSKVTTKNLILDNPVTNTSKLGHSWTTSDGHYKLGNEKADFLFEGEPQVIFGICGKWPMNIKPEDQNMENIEGLQVCYPLHSQETLKNPTANETTLKTFLKGVLWQKCWDSMQEFNKNDLIDGPAGSACTTALAKKIPEYAMKPVFSFPQTKNEKTGKTTSDTTKSERIYVELVTQGKGAKMRCLTPIRGPGDKLVSYMKFFSTQDNYIIGTIHPVFRWKGTFWGAHGKSTHGGSVKIEIVEMNFTPRKAATLSYSRMLGSNTAPEEKSGGSQEEGGDEFTHPMGGKSSRTGIVDSDFSKPGEDENVDTLLGKNNTNDENEGGSDGENEEQGDGSDDEDEKQKAEEEAKAKAAAKAREAAIAKKKAQIAARKAATKK